jgi:hypothetical protein
MIFTAQVCCLCVQAASVGINAASLKFLQDKGWGTAAMSAQTPKKKLP